MPTYLDTLENVVQGECFVLPQMHKLIDPLHDGVLVIFTFL